MRLLIAVVTHLFDSQICELTQDAYTLHLAEEGGHDTIP